MGYRRVVRLAQFMLLAASISPVLAGGYGSEASGVVASRRPLRHVVLIGKVKSLGVTQEEPNQTPQVNFDLEVSDSEIGTQDVSVGMPEISFHCFDDWFATLEGDFAPADELFPSFLLSPKLLSCDRDKPRH